MGCGAQSIKSMHRHIFPRLDGICNKTAGSLNRSSAQKAVTNAAHCCDLNSIRYVLMTVSSIRTTLFFYAIGSFAMKHFRQLATLGPLFCFWKLFLSSPI